MNKPKILVVTTHPIQYQVPLFADLAKTNNLHVLFLTNGISSDLNSSSFNVNFDWDIPLFNGYEYSFANNISKNPSPNTKEGIVIENAVELLGQHNPSVIILFGWYTKAHRQIIKASRRMQIPIIFRGESTMIMESSRLKSLIKKVYFPNFLNKFSHFLSVGKENEKFYLHYGVEQKKITLAPYSINTPLFEYEYAKISHESQNDAICIGFSGKFIEKKRPLDLIQAVSKSRFSQQIKLIMVGDGVLLKEAKELVKKLGISAEFKGFLNQSEIVTEGYGNMDALVLPSGDYETWGLVVNEAMTGGIPAIVSNKVGSHTDLIDETTGFTFESGNIDDLAEKINKLCENMSNDFPYKDNVLKKIEKYSLKNTVTGFNLAIKQVLRDYPIKY